MSTEAWQQRSHCGYYLPLTSFATVASWVPLAIATSDEAPEPFAITAVCGCVISDDLGNLPPCVECDRCEEHCPCVCERCGEPLHAMRGLPRLPPGARHG
jgi:hypothetical protein